MTRYSSPTRMFFGGPVTYTVKLLITINVAVFLLQLVGEMIRNPFLVVYLGLRPTSVTNDFMIWQFATYMFLHGGFFHIFFNMLTLFMFGNDLERIWGRHRFLRYYFATGIGAGICSWLVAMESPAVIIGASGAVYGILLAYGLLWPNRIVYLNFLLPVKVKWLVLVMGVMAFFSSVTGGDPGVAHIAHLGGMLVGFVYLRGKDWLAKYQLYQYERRRAELKRQFEVYYGDVRKKIDDQNKKGPTIH